MTEDAASFFGPVGGPVAADPPDFAHAGILTAFAAGEWLNTAEEDDDEGFGGGTACFCWSFWAVGGCCFGMAKLTNRSWKSGTGGGFCSEPASFWFSVSFCHFDGGCPAISSPGRLERGPVGIGPWDWACVGRGSAGLVFSTGRHPSLVAGLRGEPCFAPIWGGLPNLLEGLCPSPPPTRL